MKTTPDYRRLAKKTDMAIDVINELIKDFADDADDDVTVEYAITLLTSARRDLLGAFHAANDISRPETK